MNAAAQLVFSASRYDQIMPLLHRLHWLRAPQRISFKLAVLPFRCLRGIWVSDVSEWQPATCGRYSRSTTFAFCVISRSCCATDTSSNSRWSSVLCCGGKKPGTVFRQKWRHQWHCRHLNKNLKLTFSHCHFPARNISPYWRTVTAMLLHLFTKIMIDWLIKRWEMKLLWILFAAEEYIIV